MVSWLARRSIQEPSLYGHPPHSGCPYNKLLRLVSFDMEKAFDRAGHYIIVQALWAYCMPEITTMAIQYYMLVDFAYL
jgi:hypothetical protein